MAAATPSMAAVSFRIWTPDGILVTDANVRLLDRQRRGGRKNEGDSQFGPVWAVHPGTCRVMIDLPGGKSITAADRHSRARAAPIWHSMDGNDLVTE